MTAPRCPYCEDTGVMAPLRVGPPNGRRFTVVNGCDCPRRPPPYPRFVRIRTPRSGPCGACPVDILPGESIWFAEGHKAFHVECPSLPDPPSSPLVLFPAEEAPPSATGRVGAPDELVDHDRANEWIGHIRGQLSRGGGPRRLPPLPEAQPPLAVDPPKPGRSMRSTEWTEEDEPF